jgi:hypothetical protein
MASRALHLRAPARRCREAPRCGTRLPLTSSTTTTLRWLQARESNPRPTVVQTVALPTELACCGSCLPQGAVHMIPSPSAGSRASRDSRARTAAPWVIDTDLRTVRRLRDAPNPSFRFRSNSGAPKRRGPGGQLPTGASRGFTGGLLHEHAHPERAGLTRQVTNTRKQVFAHAREQCSLMHERTCRGKMSGCVVHRGAHSTLKNRLSRENPRNADKRSGIHDSPIRSCRHVIHRPNVGSAPRAVKRLQPARRGIRSSLPPVVSVDQLDLAAFRKLPGLSSE